MFRYFHVSFRIVYDEKTAKQRVNKTCFIYTIYSTTLLVTIKPVLICLQHYISVFILKGLFCNDCQGSYGIWKENEIKEHTPRLLDLGQDYKEPH